MAKKIPALKFTVGGAPAAFSSLAGFAAPFHPDHPTPLSELGITPELATLFDGDPGCPVQLVQITTRQADEYCALAAHHTAKE